MTNKKAEIKDLVMVVSFEIVLTIIIVLILNRLDITKQTLYLLAKAFPIVISTIMIFLLYEKYPLKIFNIFNRNSLIAYILLGTIICLIVNFPYIIWFGNYKDVPLQYNLFVHYNNFNKATYILLMCLLGPITEELLFRGFYYRLVRNRYGVFVGATVSITLFILFHFQISNLLYLLIPALVYVYVYEKTKSIIASIVTHSLNNTLWFVLAYAGTNWIR